MSHLSVKLPLPLYTEIIMHAQEEWPLEACGIIAGKDWIAEKILRCENIEKSPKRFRISALEQMKILEWLDKENLSMIGIYHSHPHSDPFPSGADLSYFFYPEVFWLIVSLKRREKPRSCAFIKDGDRIKEIELVFI